MSADVNWAKLRCEAIDVRPAKPKRQRRKIDWNEYIDGESAVMLMWVSCHVLIALTAVWVLPYLS